jgi:microcystin-dependent protein
MAEPYIGEIKIWAFDWAPRGWALCNGALLPIAQNQALYSILGTRFGGDGKVNFALPELRGRTPVGPGAAAGTTTPNYTMGNSGGSESVTLSSDTVPSHAHGVNAVIVAGTQLVPSGNLIANVVSAKAGSTTNFSVFRPQGQWTADAQLAAGSVETTGASAPHANMQPFAVVNFAICISGYYPPHAD